VTASQKGHSSTAIYNGSLIRIDNGYTDNGDNIYMLVSYPRVGGGTAGLMLIMLTTGGCYSLKPMDAIYDHDKTSLFVTGETLKETIGSRSWEYVQSVTITMRGE
jgi:hypothetical protein